jgi:hypothetical protein
MRLAGIVISATIVVLMSLARTAPAEALANAPPGDAACYVDGALLRGSAADSAAGSVIVFSLFDAHGSILGYESAPRAVPPVTVPLLLQHAGVRRVSCRTVLADRSTVCMCGDPPLTHVDVGDSGTILAIAWGKSWAMVTASTSRVGMMSGTSADADGDVFGFSSDDAAPAWQIAQGYTPLTFAVFGLTPGRHCITLVTRDIALDRVCFSTQPAL